VSDLQGENPECNFGDVETFEVMGNIETLRGIEGHRPGTPLS
jgi:hypothetical protein